MTRGLPTAFCVGWTLAILALVAGGCSVRDGGAAPRPSSSSVSAADGTPEHRPPHVEHVVVCWLKDPGNAAHRQRLIDASRDFVGKIPGLVSVRAGGVLPSTRPSVDSSFDVAIVMTFANERSLAGYGQTPVHQRALRDVLRPLVDHYVVYDFTDGER